MPDTGTEPGNPGTIAAVPLPNAQTPLGTLACTHKHTYIHIHTCRVFGSKESQQQQQQITHTTTTTTT